VPAAALTATAVVGSAAIGSSATKSAAKTSANAANRAADLQNEQFQQTRSDMAPWRNYGAGAMGMLAQIYGVPYGANGVSDMAAANDPGAAGNSNALAGGGQPTNALAAGGSPNRFGGFFTSPDYEFKRAEGLRDIERTAAGRGSLMSGGTLKALTRYGGDLASGEWNNYVNRLASLAGVGQSSSYQTGVLGANAANNSGNALMAGANARAAGTLANGQTWGNALSGLGGIGANVANNNGFNFLGGSDRAGVNFGNALAASGNYYTGNYAGTGVPF
jgi:hypothetical protein